MMSTYLAFNVSQQLRSNEGRWPYVYDYCHYCSLGMSHPVPFLSMCWVYYRSNIRLAHQVGTFWQFLDSLDNS